MICARTAREDDNNINAHYTSFLSLLSVKKLKRFLLSYLTKHMANASSFTVE